MDGAQKFTQGETLDVQRSGVQPSAAAPHAEILQVPTVSQALVPCPAITESEKKMLGRFLRLAPSRFSRATGEDAHDFISSCEERLHNLGLLESHGLDYTTF